MFKRKIIIITLSYMIGILGGIYLKKYIPFFCTSLLIIIFILKYSNKNKQDYKSCVIIKVINIFLILLIVILISYFFTIQSENNYNKIYKYDNNEIYCVAEIKSYTKPSEYYNNYVIEVKEIAGRKEFKNKSFILKLSKKINSYKIEYGNLIVFNGKYLKPESSRNYKGYNYQEYLKTQNIYGIIECEGNEVKIIENSSKNYLMYGIKKLQNKIKDNIYKIISTPNANICMAILLGDKTQISVEEKEIFSNAGLSHILAISGMHVSFVLLGLQITLKKIGKRSTNIFIIVFLTFFSILTGGSSSVIRAVTMVIISQLAKLLFTKSDTLNNIAVAGLVILLLNKYEILNIGFQLSFLGTLGIVLFYEKIVNIFKRKERKLITNKIISKILYKIKELVIIAISANLLIFPIIMYKFNQISLIFLISNIIITPLTCVICILGYITLLVSLISINLSRIFAFFLNAFLSIFIMISHYFSNISFLRITIITPNIFFICSIYVIIFYLFSKSFSKGNLIKHLKIVLKIFFHKYNFDTIIMKLKNQSKFLGILQKYIMFFLLIIAIISNINFQNKFQIYFVDVGQGDCTLIITPKNNKILVDGGGSENYDVGKNVLIPYLLDRKIYTIDYLIFSHFDTDHCKRFI